MATNNASTAAESRDPVRVTNAAGGSRYVIVCEHASNWLPPSLGTLGLDPSEMERHIAWDPGALPVAQRLAELLDATLVESRVSRLAIDCNRPSDAPDLIAQTSETTRIPGNEGLGPEAREARIALSYRPFHDALAAQIDSRLAKGRAAWIVTVHSFTPVYKGVSRPWHIGIIHDADERLASPLLARLGGVSGIAVGANQPYSPADRVYYTLERHARLRGLPCAMIEIRNDEIADAAAQESWAKRLADILSGIEESDLKPGMETASAKGTRRSA
ncbi:MAG: N-formylglutamate amidohydrolase [Mesorhizobium sp.]|nr:N-formylglutamate amidohydrolase [Mesorhizobium sp.]